MASQAFKVLYTKQLTRKLKTYNDGFLVRDGPRVRLLDDAGMELGTGRCPSSLQLTAASDGIKLFDGFLVDCDEELASAAEVPRRSPSGGGIRAPQPSVMRDSDAANAAAAAPSGTSAMQIGARNKFRPPRVADAPPPAATHPQPGATQGWHAADVAHASTLGKRWHAGEQQTPSREACHTAQPPPPVHRSGE